MFDFSDTKKRFFFSGLLSFLIFAFFISLISSMLDSKSDNVKGDYVKSEEVVKKEVLNNLEDKKIEEESNKDMNVDKKSVDKYVVKKGDYLYKISTQTGVSVSELKKINNLKSNNLSIGQVLLLK